MNLLAVLIAAILFAQPSANSPGQVTVRAVNDRRATNGFARLSVTVELPAFRAWDVASSRVLIKSAVDDAGTNLVSSSEEPKLEMNQRQEFQKGEPTAPPMVQTIELKNPPRSAKTLKELRGEIELYMPSRDPNGVANVGKFLSQSGKPLSDRALKANGVGIAVISKAQFETMKKAAADKRRAEAKAEGREGEDLDRAVSDFLEYDYLSPEEGDVLLKVTDPNKRIESISYVDKGGEVKRVNMQEKSGIMVLSTWGDKPQPDWTMRVNLRTSKTLVRYPFALTDVALP